MIYKVKPTFSEKIWGGNKIKEVFNLDIPSNKTGEAWIISGYKSNPSLLENSGETLSDFYKNNKEQFNNYNSEEFPLLIKILDANDDLSIQVHPNDDESLKLHGVKEGKSEAWYVLDAKNTDIIIGHNAKDKNELKEMFDNSAWDKFIKAQPVVKGDVFNIEPGTVHAIRKNTLIYEIQQSSDRTYRIYDYDRLENGKPRELHLDESLEVIKYEEKDVEQQKVDIYSSDTMKIVQLVQNQYFNLFKLDINGVDKHSFNKDMNFLLITIIDGEVKINETSFIKGESGIITVDSLENISFEGKGEILIGNPN